MALIEIHHYVHFLSPPTVHVHPDERIGTMLALLQSLNQRVDIMSGSVSDLTTQVAANTSVVQSAIVLINGFADRLAAAGTDPAKLAALQAELATSDTALANAVAANTPAAPAGPTDPATPVAPATPADPATPVPPTDPATPTP